MRGVSLLLLAFAATARSQSRCSSDADCDELRARCDLRRSGRCQCWAGFTSWLDGCVPHRQLSQSCQVSAQCRAVDEHAECQPQRRVCVCRLGYSRHGLRCVFQFRVTTPPPPPPDEADHAAGLAGLLGGRQRDTSAQRRHHQRAFERGLAVTAVLTALTAAVFLAAALVSRRLRQADQQADSLPLKLAPAGPPPPYSLALSTPAACSLAA